ncbi:MAG: hypothetical protein WAX89_01495 [Alphaproteobacteria bacterium]
MCLYIGGKLMMMSATGAIPVTDAIWATYPTSGQVRATIGPSSWLLDPHELRTGGFGHDMGVTYLLGRCQRQADAALAADNSVKAAGK